MALPRHFKIDLEVKEVAHKNWNILFDSIHIKYSELANPLRQKVDEYFPVLWSNR
jgi:hypothetical protein